MSILISVLLIVEVLAAFLLIVVILAQKSKDQGLGMAFGGGMGESLFGSRAGNVLTRMTVTLAAVFMLTTIVLGILFARGNVGSSGSVMDKAARQMPMAPAAPAAAPLAAPQQSAAPIAMDETPIAPVAEGSAPVVLQMGEGGELVPAQAPVAAEAPSAPVAVEDAPPAEAAPEAPAPEAAPAP
jgi:preprotein translocase subunit SecG